MNVFISWSGERSKHVADALRNWIPKVLQAVRPWMSDEDIATGARWSSEIGTELEHTKVGIICLTQENQHSPWLMFEAGALSKSISQSYVCPYLTDLTASQVSGPLAQFQSARADREGTARILQTLNKALGTSQLPPPQLEEVFEVWWPKLEAHLATLPPTTQGGLIRSTEDLLEEIVENTREQLRRENIRLASVQDRDAKLDHFISMWESAYKSMSMEGVHTQEQISAVVKNLQTLPAFASLGITNNTEATNIAEIFPQMLTHLKDLQKESREETQKLLQSNGEEPVSD